MTEPTCTAAEMEAKARAAGLSMNETCRRAGLHRSLFTKWKAGTKGLTLDSYDRLMAVIRDAEAGGGSAAVEPSAARGSCDAAALSGRVGRGG